MDMITLYREIFKIFSNGKRSFGSKELGEIMESYGLKPSELELQDMINEIDGNASGAVEFRDFVEFMSKKIKRREAQDELREALRIFKTGDDSFITAATLRDFLTNLGERFSNEEVDEMLIEFGMNKDSEIEIEEIVNIISSFNK